MQPLWNFLKTLKIELPYDPAIALQGIYPKKMKTVTHVVMYGCESWAVKKAEHRRTDAFELWC